MTPFFIEGNNEDKMKVEVVKYGPVIKELAEKHDAIFVNTQKAIDELLEYNYSVTIALDRVHPTSTGHMVVAKAFPKAIGFEWK